MNTQTGDRGHKGPRPDQIHLKDYLAVIGKRRAMVLFIFLVLVGIAAAASFLATPVYEATATIIIERQIYAVTHAEQDLNADIRENDYYQTQYNLLQSRSLALKVIRDLQLWKEYASESPPVPGDASAKVRNAVDELMAKVSGQPHAAPEAGQPADPSPSEWSDLVDWYLASLRIDPVKGSRLINISFRSSSPETAAKVANAHAHAFIARSREMKMAASGQKLNWLKQQPPERSKNLFSRPQVSDKDENMFSLPEVSQDPVILALRNQLIQLKAKQQEWSSNYGPKHPKMTELNAQIAQVGSEITEEAKRVSRVVSSTFDSSNITIIDDAETPLDPVSPNRFRNILMAVIMAMFIGPFFAFFAEYMDRTVKTPGDAERRLGMAVLGTVPAFRSLKRRNNGLLSWEDRRSGRKKNSYAYDGDTAVRFIPGLLTMPKQRQGRLFFVSSATSEEGKTTVLANSAISLACRGIRVLVVDTDIFRPALHSAFGVGNKAGLTSLLSGMLAKNIAAGDLTTFSVDDLFFLVALRRLRGVLAVTNDGRTMKAFFDNGRLVHLESSGNPSDTRLGTMLVRGGFLNQGQLDEALAWHERTGRPLGYVMVNMGLITPERLRGPLRLQTEELLQRLFSWKQGAFTFEQDGNGNVGRDDKIYGGDDYLPVIQRLGRAAGSHYIENEVLSRIIPADGSKVFVLPAGGKERKPNIGPDAQMLFAKILEILKRHFDVVLVDSPPVLEMPDSAVLAREGDGVLFVTKAGKLSDKTILQAADRLQESGAHILGLVLNQAKG